MKEEIRYVKPDDVTGLKEVLDSSELFPSEYLDDMIADYFNNPDTEDIWFTYVADGHITGLGYCAPEKLTNGTYNLLAIAVRKDYQGKGAGKKMIEFIEQTLKAGGKRLLIVETSSLDNYTLTRQFYKNLGYTHAATIADFWNDGEDKVIFSKKLN